MPEAVIFLAAEAIDVGLVSSGLLTGELATEGALAFAAGSTFGISNVALIQGGLALAASIGLAYASRSEVPKPADGTQGIKESIQPRQRGYWENRLGGAVVFFEAIIGSGGTAYQVNAVHHGEVESLIAVYFDDDNITTTPDIEIVGGGTVNPPSGTQYTFCSLSFHKGLPVETSHTLLSADPNINSQWTTAHIGHGIASLAMTCTAPGNAEDFQNMWPRGLPRPSVVCVCSKTWDPRTGVTAASPNPVVQLIDYLTLEDGGCGYPLAEIIPAAVLEQWKTEADLCDADPAGPDNIRYTSAGWYRFDNKPEDVINHILSTCDGWLADAGDGTLALTVGVYREPTDPALTEDYILDLVLNYGMSDESVVNQLDVSWTDRNLKYTEVQLSVRDEVSIAETGVTRAQPLDLTWCQRPEQADRLARRALLRLNPRRSGSFTTTLYGMRYLGKRWVKLQYSPVSDLADCVIEIQGADVDLLGGTVTFTWILVDPEALLALQ